MLGPLRFHVVGLVEVLLLILIFGLTVYVHWQRDVRHSQAVKEASILRSELEDKLWSWELTLAECRYTHMMSQPQAERSQEQQTQKEQLALLRQTVKQIESQKSRMEMLVKTVENLPRAVDESVTKPTQRWLAFEMHYFNGKQKQ